MSPALGWEWRWHSGDPPRWVWVLLAPRASWPCSLPRWTCPPLVCLLAGLQVFRGQALRAFWLCSCMPSPASGHRSQSPVSHGAQGLALSALALCSSISVSAPGLSASLAHLCVRPPLPPSSVSASPTPPPSLVSRLLEAA